VLAPAPEEEQRRALVQRIVASRHFAKAHQLRDILLYLVDRACLSPAAPIHEQQIACAVLGRKADFNPQEDNIVRVQVSHLRKRLDEYYAAEGREEGLRISVPKGGYSPRFETCLAGPVSVSNEEPMEAKPETTAASGFAGPYKPWRALYRPLLIAQIVLAAAVLLDGYFWLRNLSTRAGSSPATRQAHAVENDLLWPKLFKAHSSNIVVADSNLVMLQDILHTDIELPDYLDGQYPGNLLDKVTDLRLQSALRLISLRQYTSLADLTSAERLAELSHRYSPVTPAIRYARHINVRDFKTGTFILVGSRRGIPWVRLFESQLNFFLDEDRNANTYYYRNKNPLHDEPQGWYQKANRDSSIETYADIALVPNLGHTGYVLILSGITMEATEAAGDFVAGAEFPKELAAILPKVRAHPQLRYFELLLRTRAVAGAASSSQVVASRIQTTPVPDSL
jgi:hypothetical protein